ncbi:hypothetical protein ACEWX3_15215 [Mycobacterium sp. G7A2]|uniref:hypothetical protein n=1 Tax=Mycobacterium sp. G7A2 TaxID=3317307 RepID=UPI0035A9370E
MTDWFVVGDAHVKDEQSRGDVAKSPASGDAGPGQVSAEPQNQETRSDTGQSGFSMVGLTGFEPATT